jgi:hypothetical protein
MVLLYSISKELSINELTFDLYWGFPLFGNDYLDGTCMLYTGTGPNSQLCRTFDYNKRIFGDIPNMSHSGDVMDSYLKRGKETIRFNMKKFEFYLYIFFRFIYRTSSYYSKFGINAT